MADYGTVSFEVETNRTSHGISQLRRITHADRSVRFGAELLDDVRNNGHDYGDWLDLVGDVLTIRDDYGQRFIYRIDWSDYADGGYLAEWPD